MRIPKTRYALALSAAVVAALAVGGPAGATDSETSCTPLLTSTPAVVTDVDGNGHPELRVPSFRDVRLCVQSDVEVHYSEPLDIHHCAEGLSCVAFRVTVGFAVDADTGIALCYSIDSLPACTGFDPGGVPVGAGPQTICIGYDLAGGNPCAGLIFGAE